MLRRVGIVLAVILGCALPALPALAVQCETLEFEGASFDLCRVNPAQDKVALFHTDAKGAPFAHFSSLNRALGAKDKDLLFAMNAGMFHQDLRPVGHYVENGTEKMRVIASAGPGNFGMLPNGVFCIKDSQARVFETQAYLAEKPQCRDATQSGPMLVIDGALHPRLLPQGTSRYIRNGVGSNDDGSELVFVISNQPVNFHTFARVFRDALGLSQALYLDGNVSRLFAPDLGRADRGRALGPMVAVTSSPAE